MNDLTGPEALILLAFTVLTLLALAGAIVLTRPPRERSSGLHTSD